jgi:hypothetical protein
MLWLRFAGWFQCRLATDPDPADEPRGVSGYAHAVAGEPDLDRIIRLQPPGTVQRSRTPAVGVTVRAVVLDSQRVADHPLTGARLDLLESPRFEGRNGIVAEGGLEPIVPFVLEVAHERFRLGRRHADAEEFPFDELKAAGVQPGLSAIAEETGVYDLAAVWRERRAALERDLAATMDPIAQAALRKRITVLNNAGLARFFGVRMLYGFGLRGAARVADPDGWLPAAPASEQPWPVDFWLGAWDADAFQGYMRGALGVPLVGERDPAEALVERLGDPTAPLRA